MPNDKLLPSRTGSGVTFYEVWKNGQKAATYQSFTDAWHNKQLLGNKASVIRLTQIPILGAMKPK